MIGLHVNKNSDTPIFRQIMDGLIAMIESKTLTTGFRLPSSRELSSKLEVNRSTVIRAYQELWAQGYVDCRPGSYTTVRYRHQQVSVKQPKPGSFIDWEKKVSSISEELFSRFGKKKFKIAEGSINFSSLSPDPRLYPIENYRKSQSYVMKSIGAPLLQYGESLGFYPLREFIAQRMRIYGINTSADEIMITGGVQQSMNLLFQLLASPSSEVLMEEPTYSSVIPLFKLYNVKPIPVTMSDKGADLDVLKNHLEEKNPAFFYTMPNFHNPMGITTSHAHREKLLGLCKDAKLPIIEDGFEEELKYFGKAVAPLKAMDSEGIVIYLGTFSKVLFPGLRIGWIAADQDCINRLGLLKQINITSDNIMEQAALEHYCRSGEYEIHVKRMNREYRKRMKLAITLVKQSIPESAFQIIIPAGGYTIWVEAKDQTIKESLLLSKIEEQGVEIVAGSNFFTQTTSKIGFRISIAHCNEHEIKEGMKRLATALSFFA